jgi:hypothetical protein
MIIMRRGRMRIKYLRANISANSYKLLLSTNVRETNFTGKQNNRLTIY